MNLFSSWISRFPQTYLPLRNFVDWVVDLPFKLRTSVVDRYEECRIGEQLRVVFVLSVDSEWDCFSRLHQLFIESPRVKVTVLADDSGWGKSERLTSELFLVNGIQFMNAADYSVDIHRPHVLFIADEISIKAHPWILNSRARIVYIPYGTSISAAYYSRRQQYNLKLHNRSWRICVAGEFAKDLYGKYCRNGNDHVVACGHPKSEVIQIANSRYECPTLPASYDRPRVFLWNINFRDGKWSTWKEYGLEILKIFSEREDVRLICRPHPFFFDAIADVIESNKIRIAIVSNRNTLLDESPSMINAIAESDAMLTDGSSIIYDYCVTGKPMLYLRTPSSELLHDHAFKLVRKWHYIGDEIKKIASFIDMVCLNADWKRNDRMRNCCTKAGIPNPAMVSVSIKQIVESEIVHT